MFFKRFKRIRIDENGFFYVLNFELEAMLVKGTALTLFVFADEGFVFTVLAKTNNMSLVAFGAFGQVDFMD